MHGLDMMNFVLNDVSELIRETIDEFGGKDNFDLFALHQANEMIVKTLAVTLGLPMAKVAVAVNGYGNTSSASIPLALTKVIEQKNHIGSRFRVLMAGFGSGASWGTAVTDLSSTKFYPILEME